ncbi:MAG: hypothetical protein ACXWQ5_00930 [Ktedonobacterales bacterium]
MRTTSYHPSNVLYRGEAEDFAQAMQLVLDECDTELLNAQTLVPDDEFMTEGEIERLVVGLERYKDAASLALLTYNKAIQSGCDDEAARLAVYSAYGASDDGDLRAIAEAAYEDDYAALAI